MNIEAALFALENAELLIGDEVAIYCGMDYKAGRIVLALTLDDLDAETREEASFLTYSRDAMAIWLTEPTFADIARLALKALAKAETEDDARAVLRRADEVIRLLRGWLEPAELAEKEPENA